MLIARKERATHWYMPDGTPFYDVPRADGKGLRPARITDATKVGALRSVTNVLSVLGKPGLVNWQVEQGILAALTLPRRPDETDHDFAHRALADSEAQVSDAASAGTAIHDLAAEYLVNAKAPELPKQVNLLLPFMRWADANVARTIYSEKVVANPAYYYAGRLDAFVELKEGGYAIIDLKTQEITETKNGVPQGKFYDEWPMQLAAYAQCEALQFWTPANHRLFSLVIGRNMPFCGPKEWPRDAGHFRAFAHACGLWSYIKGCTPGRKDDAT
jgi:hypothetical protein